ncbi:DUF6415 family natural product biosynthesis protein [Streptomyces sp. NPDC001797]|uniref:DUF6415 family natural product biosynthesis protein n=1 Tax=Streptomyces sp. NPDC001797 TaxID=3364610 RepID=UPI0036AEA008
MPATPGPAEGLSRWAADRTDLTRLLLALRQALVDDTVYEDLEAVLGEGVAPTPREAATLAERLRDVLRHLIEIVPHRVAPYPVEEMRLVMKLSSEQPPPQEARGHLRRFALAVLAVLDLLEDD